MPKTSRSRPSLPLTRRSPLLLLVTLSCCAGLSTAPAAAQTPPSEAGLVISKAALQQCAKDAARVDGLEQRVSACQRDLDQNFGARQECARQADRDRAAAVAWELRARELEKRSTWPYVGLGVGAASAIWIAVMLIAK